LLTKIERQIRYAYLATLVGVVLATITTAYTTINSLLFSQTTRSQPPTTPGNFTGTAQFGNFTGAPRLGNMNPSAGFVNSFAILAVIIAVVGVLWLGLSLRKSSLKSDDGENASTRDKPETEQTTCVSRHGLLLRRFPYKARQELGIEAARIACPDYKSNCRLAGVSL
jgi:hypothetical protein